MNKIFWKIKIWIGKSFRIALRFYFKFDKWHLYTLTEREYAIDIIKYCQNECKNKSFAEIGCGLGDIIRNVNYQIKDGFDSDEKVLKAARFLDMFSPRVKVNFEQFQFPESEIKSKYDVIVMVNWIHHINEMILKINLQKYITDNLNQHGFLILDTVQDKEYKHNHNINFLCSNLNCRIVRIGEYPRKREIWAICKY